jgi:hypothetical protein
VAPIIFVFNIDFLYFVGPCPHRDMDYGIWSKFWKFCLIKIGFTLGELVSLVKVFRLFKLEHMFFGVQSVDTVGRCTTSYLLVGPMCLWCLVFKWFLMCSPSYYHCFHIHSSKFLNLFFNVLVQFPNNESFFILHYLLKIRSILFWHKYLGKNINSQV